jgi:hypothetical protein
VKRIHDEGKCNEDMKAQLAKYVINSDDAGEAEDDFED